VNDHERLLIDPVEESLTESLEQLVFVAVAVMVKCLHSVLHAVAAAAAQNGGFGMSRGLIGRGLVVGLGVGIVRLRPARDLA